MLNKKYLKKPYFVCATQFTYEVQCIFEQCDAAFNGPYGMVNSTE